MKSCFPVNILPASTLKGTLGSTKPRTNDHSSLPPGSHVLTSAPVLFIYTWDGEGGGGGGLPPILAYITCMCGTKA